MNHSGSRLFGVFPVTYVPSKTVVAGIWRVREEWSR